MQKDEDVEHQDVKLYCATNQSPESQFFDPHNKPHGVRGLSKHYHMRFDTKLGHGTCEIRRITSTYAQCKPALDQH